MKHWIILLYIFTGQRIVAQETCSFNGLELPCKSSSDPSIKLVGSSKAIMNKCFSRLFEFDYGKKLFYSTWIENINNDSKLRLACSSDVIQHALEKGESAKYIPDGNMIIYNCNDDSIEGCISIAHEMTHANDVVGKKIDITDVKERIISEIHAYYVQCKIATLMGQKKNSRFIDSFKNIKEVIKSYIRVYDKDAKSDLDIQKVYSAIKIDLKDKSKSNEYFKKILKMLKGAPFCGGEGKLRAIWKSLF